MTHVRLTIHGRAAAASNTGADPVHVIFSVAQTGQSRSAFSVCIRMKPHTANGPEPRSTKASPDFRPDWRNRVIEEYVLEIEASPDATKAAERILQQENDVVVRQVLCFHLGRFCGSKTAIEYALRCHRSRGANIAAGFIEAGAIANMPPRDIASHIGATGRAVALFELLFFDARRSRDAQVWLQDVVSRTPPDDMHYARLRVTALARGAAGLMAIFQSRRDQHKKSGRLMLERFTMLLLARALDYYAGLEIRGVAVSERDMALLAGFERVAAGAFAAEVQALEFSKPLTAKQVAEERKAAEMVGKLSPASRRKVANFLDQVKQHIAAGGADQGGASGSPVK